LGLLFDCIKNNHSGVKMGVKYFDTSFIFSWDHSRIMRDGNPFNSIPMWIFYRSGSNAPSGQNIGSKNICEVLKVP